MGIGEENKNKLHEVKEIVEDLTNTNLTELEEIIEDVRGELIEDIDYVRLQGDNLILIGEENKNKLHEVKEIVEDLTNTNLTELEEIIVDVRGELIEDID